MEVTKTLAYDTATNIDVKQFCSPDLSMTAQRHPTYEDLDTIERLFTHLGPML
jgi:hypothetical protein